MNQKLLCNAVVIFRAQHYFTKGFGANTCRILMSFATFYRPRRGLSNNAKIIKIREVLAFLMHQNLLHNDVVIFRMQIQQCNIHFQFRLLLWNYFLGGGP